MASGHGHHGQESSLELDVEPVSVDGSSLDLSVNVRSRFGREAKVQYAITVSDDHGTLVERQRVSGIARVRKGGISKRAETIGEDLDDGYYAVHVNAVGVTSETHGAASHDLYFEVREGSATPIDEATYFAYSDGLQPHVSTAAELASVATTSAPVSNEQEVTP